MIDIAVGDVSGDWGPQMKQDDFERMLDRVCAALTAEAQGTGFSSSGEFERRVREEVAQDSEMKGEKVDFDPRPQAFPDIAIRDFGIEVKFTENNTWRSVANSVFESTRVKGVKITYLVFGKMGGTPEVKWGEYGKSVIHVRTSHVPRFEVELDTDRSLFDLMGVPYDVFRELSMPEKMQHIRGYARGRLKPGERLWWLDDQAEPEHSLPLEVRLYTSLDAAEKARLRAEGAILCPQIVKGAAQRGKYDDVVLYLMTYYGVLCHQARDLFSAGSVANPNNDDEGGIYIERALKLLEEQMVDAASRLEDALFVEYWGQDIPPNDRLAFWLEKADGFATNWVPSRSLFLEYQQARK